MSIPLISASRRYPEQPADRCPTLLSCNITCEAGLQQTPDGCHVCKCKPGMSAIWFNLHSTRAKKKLGILFWFSPSVTSIFCCTFLNNHASQPFHTWYGASARGPTCFLRNSRPPVIYFLFPGSVHFWTLHLGITGVYSVSKKSQISCFYLDCFNTSPHNPNF